MSDAAAAQEVKRSVRAAVRARRAAMPAERRASAAEALTAVLVEASERLAVRSVTCFISTADEPDTGPFLEWASRRGIEVLLPVSQRDRTLRWAVRGDAPAVPGLHGIPEPPGERLPADAAAGVDLMLVPACAVDRRGTRLGWGLGYYDRCLAALPERPPVYAVVFDEDVLPALPRDPHDVPVTGAATPGGLLRFDAAGA
ncbi:5-formyltetrahydrofolate cyclo-ligase [Leucobacter zeae]|nr:5-formyltetrahydrofolate cyclo-ligase [Leucobacter zeae]